MALNYPFTIELPLSVYAMTYPDYNNDRDNYFKFRPFFELVKGTGVEVGTFEGYNALGACRFSKLETLYCVDPYKEYVCEIGAYMETFSQEVWDDFYLLAQKRLKDYPAKFLRMTSKEGSEFLPDDLDFVYLDGDHSTQAVLKDIRLWYPKVKVGGLLGGHDAVESEVKQALTQWVIENNLKYAGLIQARWNDWWIVKE